MWVLRRDGYGYGDRILGSKDMNQDRKCPRCNDIGKALGCPKCGKTLIEKAMELPFDVIDKTFDFFEKL